MPRKIGTYSTDIHHGSRGFALTDAARDLLSVVVLDDAEGKTNARVMMIRDDTAEDPEAPEGGPLCFVGIEWGRWIAWTCRAPDSTEDLRFEQLSPAWQAAYRTFVEG